MRVLSAWTLLLLGEFLLFSIQGPAVPFGTALDILFGALFLIAPLAALTVPLEFALVRRPVWWFAGAAILGAALLLLNVQAFRRGFPVVPIALVLGVCLVTGGAVLSRRHRIAHVQVESRGILPMRVFVLSDMGLCSGSAERRGVRENNAAARYGA